jgi:hypothetical protein
LGAFVGDAAGGVLEFLEDLDKEEVSRSWKKRR